MSEAKDPLYDEAVKLVVQQRCAKVSFLQRNLGTRYVRSAGLIRRMELEGIVSEPDVIGRREVIMPKCDYCNDTGYEWGMDGRDGPCRHCDTAPAK